MKICLPSDLPFPQNMHPMTQFSAAVLALQTESEFAKAYAKCVAVLASDHVI